MFLNEKVIILFLGKNKMLKSKKKIILFPEPFWKSLLVEWLAHLIKWKSMLHVPC